MKPIALSFCAALIAFAAVPAFAGMEFTDTAVNNGGSVDFTFNGSTATGQATAVSVNNGLNGPATSAVVSSNLAPASVNPTTGAVEFQYTGANGYTQARYDTTSGSPGYTMVVEFGAINVGGTFASLQSIEFKDTISGYATIYNVNQALTNADSNRRFLIFVPSAVPPGVALSDRDLVTAVRLTFLFNGGSATSIDVKAVANPEPGTIALFGLGGLGLLGAARARRKKRLAAAAQNA